MALEMHCWVDPIEKSVKCSISVCSRETLELIRADVYFTVANCSIARRLGWWFESDEVIPQASASIFSVLVQKKDD